MIFSLNFIIYDVYNYINKECVTLILNVLALCKSNSGKIYNARMMPYREKLYIIFKSITIVVSLSSCTFIYIFTYS